jgi:hypothetical protein
LKSCLECGGRRGRCKLEGRTELLKEHVRWALEEKRPELDECSEHLRALVANPVKCLAFGSDLLSEHREVRNMSRCSRTCTVDIVDTQPNCGSLDAGPVVCFCLGVQGLGEVQI